MAERDRELDLARRRFWLGLLGLEFILDWEERGAVDRAIAGFLSLVQTGEVVLAINELMRIFRGLAAAGGRRSAQRVLGRMSGRLLGTVALGLLVLDVVAGYVRWEKEDERIHRRFRARVRALRESAGCPDPEAVFAEVGVPLP